MENEMHHDTREIPTEATLKPSTAPERKRWSAPTFERMNLKDAMNTGGSSFAVDMATCS